MLGSRPGEDRLSVCYHVNKESRCPRQTAERQKLQGLALLIRVKRCVQPCCRLPHRGECGQPILESTERHALYALPALHSPAICAHAVGNRRPYVHLIFCDGEGGLQACDIAFRAGPNSLCTR